MTKTEFQDLLHRFANSTPTEAAAVLQLKKKYPYSQVLQSLAARVSKDHTLDAQAAELQLAAVYSADRNVLKEIMGKQFYASTNLVVHPTTISTPETATIDNIDYAEAVIHDLKRLHQLKHKFEMMFIDVQAHNKKTSKIAEVQSALNVKTAKQKNTQKPITKKLASSFKTVTKTSTKQVAKNTKAKFAATKKSKAKLKPKGLSGDELISQIELTKRKLRPGNARQLEQIQLIDKFIKKQPSIANNKGKKTAATPQVDLAGLSQGQFGENVVSETLVKILISQGKKEKAVELLKKLIWKFPQKKATFAAQIENLKK
jgi:hypothetical protein